MPETQKNTFDFWLRFALCTQGLLYMASAIISSLDASLFLKLVGRPFVDHFQVQVTGALFGAIGAGALVSAFSQEISKSTLLVASLAAFGTAIVEMLYLPRWAFVDKPALISPLWIDLPYEIFLGCVTLKKLMSTSRIEAPKIISKAEMKALLFYSLAFSALISIVAFFLALKFSFQR